MQNIMFFLFKTPLRGFITDSSILILVVMLCSFLGVSTVPLAVVGIVVLLVIIFSGHGRRYNQYTKDFIVFEETLAEIEGLIETDLPQAAAMTSKIFFASSSKEQGQFKSWHRFFETQMYLDRYLSRLEMLTNQILSKGVLLSQKDFSLLYSAIILKRDIGLRFITNDSAQQAVLRLAGKAEDVCQSFFDTRMAQGPEKITVGYYLEHVFGYDFILNGSHATDRLIKFLLEATVPEQIDAALVFCDCEPGLKKVIEAAFKVAKVEISKG